MGGEGKSRLEERGEMSMLGGMAVGTGCMDSSMCEDVSRLTSAAARG